VREKVIRWKKKAWEEFFITYAARSLLWKAKTERYYGKGR